MFVLFIYILLHQNNYLKNVYLKYILSGNFNYYTYTSKNVIRKELLMKQLNETLNYFICNPIKINK